MYFFISQFREFVLSFGISVVLSLVIYIFRSFASLCIYGFIWFSSFVLSHLIAFDSYFFRCLYSVRYVCVCVSFVMYVFLF